MTTPALSVVIPIYNEEGSIEKTIAQVCSHLKVSHEILCVYDFAEDTTLPLLRTLTAGFPQLRLIRNDVCQGPSGALRSGFRYALGENILVCMADLCDQLDQLDTMLQLLADHDIVCPSRYCRGGRQEMAHSIKVWLPKLAGFFIRHFIGIPTSDPTNSFKLYSGKMLRRLCLESTMSFSVTLEIVAKAHLLGYTLVELPTHWKDRTDGVSKFRILPSIPAYLRHLLLACLRNNLFKLPLPWIEHFFRLRLPA